MDMNIKSLLLFENSKIMGKMPYKNYNCSIIKLNKKETLKITQNKYNEESILIIFFVSMLDKRYGIMSWVGLFSLNILLKLLYNNMDIDNDFWIIKPHLLQNDKGPKYADLRIFKMEKNIGVIGYSRVAPNSNTNNISDYYVRASILETSINNNLYKESNNIYHFNEIDGCCFPSKIGNNYKKFELVNNNSKIDNIEFYIKNNNNSKLITPHKSKNIYMPDLLKLNGIEISFSKNCTNEDAKTHISKKNIVPLQHIKYLDIIGCFIDFSPLNINYPIITIQNMETGYVYLFDKIFIPDSFICRKYRGSSPFVEIENNLWITIVHKREYNNNYIHNTYYKYMVLIFNSKIVNINGKNLSIPSNCIKEIPINLDLFKNNFIYISGLIILDNEFYDKDNSKLELLISYGISDNKSGISILNIKI